MSSEDKSENDCVFGHEWCDGPDAELEDGVAFGGICGECHIERTKAEK